MRVRTKALLVAICAAMLIVASVFTTMAYLTDTKTVTNTFTVGNVAIRLDEAEVDANGTALTGDAAGRTEAGCSYHLLPGHTYQKDPTVTVLTGSENCYVFIKIVNEISSIEAASEAGGYQSIADQLAANGWTAVAENSNIYYYTMGADEAKTASIPAGTACVAFRNFKIDGEKVISGSKPDAPETNKEYLGDYSEKTIVVTAYAVQVDGFDTPAAAWTATFGAPAVNP